MRSFVEIIVERQSVNRWSAYLVGLPCISATGELPEDAMLRLIVMIGADEVVIEELSAINDRMQEDRLEFRVPVSRYRPLPSPSLN